MNAEQYLHSTVDALAKFHANNSCEGIEVLYNDKWQALDKYKVPQMQSGTQFFPHRIKPESVTVWVNLYLSRTEDTPAVGYAWPTRDEADRVNQLADKARAACVKVTFTEGEGL